MVGARREPSISLASNRQLDLENSESGASAPVAWLETEKLDDIEIVVTAQRRAESIQSVPISIAAFSGQTLEKNNVLTLPDLGRIVPNLQVTRGVQSSFLRINLRGIGGPSNTTIEPSVAIFLDGSYVPRPGALVSSMLDMESVEVLRGPQGTLFGRNASAGALLLRTSIPHDELTGHIGFEIGNADRYKIVGYFNAPLGDEVALRVAGQAQWFGGYWHNALDNRRLGGTDEYLVRGSLKARFGPVEWIIRADYSKIDGDAFANLDFDASTVSPAQLAAFRERLGGVLPDIDLHDRTINQHVTADLNDRQWGASSQLSLDIGGSAIRLINNFRDWRSDQLDGDVAFTPARIVSRVGDFRSRSQNHELQFVSPSRTWLSGRLDLVGGLYYFHERYRLGERLQLNERFCELVLPAGAVRTACNEEFAATGGRDATDQEVNQTANSFAAYAQATFHVSDPLSLTIGGRYTHDSKSGSYSQKTRPFLAAVRAAEVLTLPKLDDNRFTFRLGLNYEPSDDLLFFASYSTGYKSGGYNSGAGSPALSTFDSSGNLISTQRVFNRETAKNLEVGARTEWLDGAITANITFYRMNINGYQDRAFDGTSFTVLNVGNLRQQGFELDTIVRPLANVTVQASLAYLDSEFRSYPNAQGLPGIGGVQDLTGKPVTFSPKWAGRIALEWTGAVRGTGWNWNLNANLAFTSKQFMGLTNDANPQTIEDAYAVLGARLTLHAPDNRFSLAVFGNNLTNATYSTGNTYQFLGGPLGLSNGVFAGSAAVRRGRATPRSYGVALAFQF